MITLEEISQRLEAIGLPKYDRHLMRRLCNAGFITRQESGPGLPSAFADDSINRLKAMYLASNCIYAYGHSSRVDNKITLFFMARALHDCYMRLINKEGQKRNPVLVKDFLLALKDMQKLQESDFESKYALYGYFKGTEAQYMIFESISDEQASLVNKTIEKDGKDTINHFAVVYFYFLSIVNGTLVSDIYENTREFLSFIKDTPGLATSVSNISDMNPLGEKSKAYIPANMNSLRSKTTSLLKMYDGNNETSGLLGETSKAADALTRILGLLAVLERFEGNKRDVSTWLDFILRYDNDTLWITKSIVKPALINIGCNVTTFNEKDLYLAAEFLANMRYLKS